MTTMHAARDSQGPSETSVLQAEAARIARVARRQAAQLSPWGAREPTAEEIADTFALARQHLEVGQYETAARAFAALSAVCVDQAPVFFGLGLSLQMLGHVPAARDAYHAAYLLDPLDAACLLRLGECQLALREPEMARQAWLTGLKLCAQARVDPALRGWLTQALDRLNA